MTEPNPPHAEGAATLTVLLSAWFLAQFDFFVVNVAAPSFTQGLDASSTQLQLIVAGYAFTYAAGMITGGRLGSRFGYRRVFVTGVLAFAAASLLCGVSASAPQLVAARLLQGLTGAVMVPQVLAMITAIYPAERRGRALGWYGVAGGAGSIAGQVFGGLLLSGDVLGLGWRVIFLINVPVGVVAAVLAVRVLPRVETTRATGQDPLGAVAIACALALVLVPLSLGHAEGWPAWTWVSLGAAVPAGVAAVAWQRRLHSRGRSPVVDLTLFRQPSFVTGIGAITAFMAYFSSFMFTLTLLLQRGRGLSAFEAGLVFAPMGLMFSTTALLGSRAVARYGPRAVVAGGATVGLGLLLLALLPDAGGASLGWILVALVLVGAGNGLVLPQLIGLALVDVSADRASSGSAVLSTAQQFAGAAGVALIGAVFFAAPGTNAGTRRSAFIDVALIVVVTLLVAWTTRTGRSREGGGRPRTVTAPAPAAARPPSDSLPHGS
ncbi:MFS transporter [Streptomyces sp. NPDC059398]|uniref:MFS transporter n=1 Tax=Streptomyces sp. NPDC059398 TaxID=3346820 RepID=UPI003693A602